MLRRHLRWSLVPAAAAMLAACTDRTDAPLAPHAPTGPHATVGNGTLAWFGYAPTGLDTYSLIGTQSYANWGFVSVDANELSTSASTGINTLAQHGMRSIVELGLLFWCPRPGEPANDGGALCTGWRDRWHNWKAANSAALNSGNVLAFIVRDEPWSHQVDIDSLQTAIDTVKASFPGAKMIVIEAGPTVTGSAYFSANAGKLQRIDWIGVDDYGIHPQTDAGFQSAVSTMKSRFPGKGFIYVADSWSGGLGATPGIMTEWFNVAAADPSAVLLGVFGWDDMAKNQPPSRMMEQINAGRAITNRGRDAVYRVIGTFEGMSAGYATGWACDPDAAWNEPVTVDIYSNGYRVATGQTDQSDGGSYLYQCHSGNYHRFRIWTNGYTENMAASATDLSSGAFMLTGPSTSIAWVQPSSVSWGPANTLTVAGYAQNGTGTVQMTWRDATTNGSWNVVAWQPAPDANHTWSNTIPTSNYCHDYAVYSTYNGVKSTTFTYRGKTSGYCPEKAKIIWIQPQSTAGFGPPGSLVVAGSATGAPSGTGVTMYYRDITGGGWWTVAPYVAPTDANGIWYNSIANADPYHQYAVYVSYDVVSSPTCTYAGTNGTTNC